MLKVFVLALVDFCFVWLKFFPYLPISYYIILFVHNPFNKVVKHMSDSKI